MPRRVSLPAADELFRTTGGSAVQPSAPAQPEPQQRRGARGRKPPGRRACPRPRPTRTPEHHGAPPRTSPGASSAEDRGEHSAVGEGEDAGCAGVPSAPGRPTPPGGAEHTGRERGGQDKQAAASRRSVPGQGAPQSGGRGRAPEGRACRGAAAPGHRGPQAGSRGSGALQPKPGRAAARAQEPPGSGQFIPARRAGANRRPSGRERHDEKITVYVSAEELMDLEHARLVLRGEHGLAVDRGRIVREAVAVVLADLESRGDASILVRRLRGR